MSTLRASSRIVAADHLRYGIQQSVKDLQADMGALVDRAVHSGYPGHKYEEVALAAAMAEADDSGYFTMSEVRRRLEPLTARSYQNFAFKKHLDEFCEDSRGPILESENRQRSDVYRFIDPLLPPFIVLRAELKGLASPADGKALT